MTKIRINFYATPKEWRLVMDIVSRVYDVSSGNLDIPAIQLETSLIACHVNGCPLDLEGLLHAEPFDLLHDVLGIHRHINKRTGKLENNFDPRFSRKEE